MKSIETTALVIVLLSLIACYPTKDVYQSIAQLDGQGKISMTCEYTDADCRLAMETSDPVALRTLIMQGLTLYIHYTNADSATISFPSAKDVNDKVSHHPGEVKATIQGGQEKRPDMRPLIAALNDTVLSILIRGETCTIPEYEVSIEPSSGTLTYMLHVPRPANGEGISRIKLFSRPDAGTMGQDEFSSQGFVSGSQEQRYQPFGADGARDNDTWRKTIDLDFTLGGK